MKSILFSGVFAFVALLVAGAPTYSEEEQPRYVNSQQIQQIEEFLRQRRAPFGQQYLPPCASTGSVPVFSAPTYPGYAAVSPYGYVGPHYRSVDEQLDSELLGFSDMDQAMQGHLPMARVGGYGAAGVAGVSPALSTAGGIVNQATTGTALGIFPNANVGGCSVPLLFRCSPNIVSGHMVESESQSHGASSYPAATAITSGSYRLVNEPMQHEAHDKHEELLPHEHLTHETSHTTHQ